MSLRRGITTWVATVGGMTLAYRWNMHLREAVRTFAVRRGKHVVLACGPLLVEM